MFLTSDGQRFHSWRHNKDGGIKMADEVNFQRWFLGSKCACIEKKKKDLWSTFGIHSIHIKQNCSILGFTCPLKKNSGVDAYMEVWNWGIVGVWKNDTNLKKYESFKCRSLKAWKFINKEVENCKSLRVVFKFWSFEVIKDIEVRRSVIIQKFIDADVNLNLQS